MLKQIYLCFFIFLKRYVRLVTTNRHPTGCTVTCEGLKHEIPV
jgi:hypothetical protein